MAHHDREKERRALIVVSFNRNACTPEFKNRLRHIDWADIVDVTDKALLDRIDKMSPPKKLLLNILIPRAYPRLNKKFDKLPDPRTLHIYAFNDFHYICRYLFHATTHPVTLIEDGNNNYTPIQKSLPIRLKKIIGIHPPFGRHPKVERILVQRPDDLPEDVRPKGEFLDVPGLLNDMPAMARQELIHLFLGDAGYTLDEDAVLILTQPYYDFGRIPYEQHVEVYSIIIAHFQQRNCTVYLKPHPSDTVDYSAVFPGIERLPKEFPIEILNQCSNSSIRLAVGVNTSAVNNITFSRQNVSLLPHDRNIKNQYLENLQTIRENLNKALS